MAEKDVKDSVHDAQEDNSGLDINSDDSRSGSTGLEESELEKIKSELDEARDKHLRLVAEFDNFKRRTAKERLELIQTAGREVIIDMLDVLDDADRAQKQLETTDDPKLIKEGVTLIFNKLRNVLQAKGVKPMETIGKDFDPELHEAIADVPAPSMAGKIIDEVGKGYYLKDKIIRHAKVVIGK
jgi:molecular chaperone GrpE